MEKSDPSSGPPKTTCLFAIKEDVTEQSELIVSSEVSRHRPELAPYKLSRRVS